MTPEDLDLAAALRQVLRHPWLRAELRTILAEGTAAAGVDQEGFISIGEAARRAGLRPPGHPGGAHPQRLYLARF